MSARGMPSQMERLEMAVDAANERAKVRLSQLQTVSRLTYEGLSVTLIAQRVGCKREQVRWMQRVLGWREGQAERWLEKSGKLWGERVRFSDEATT